MKYQLPAQGIMQTASYSDGKSYVVACECSDPEHQVNVWIEVDGDEETQDVQVAFYVDTWTPFWDKKFNRFKAAWDILVKGVSQQQHHIILRKQAALNFANVIESTVKDLER